MTDSNVDILLVVGIGAFGGILGAWTFQRLRVPQVIGYIVTGLIIGKSGLGLIGDIEIESLRPFNYFALGIIGFLVGGELQIEHFRKYARQYLAILVGEGLGAFLLVGLTLGAIVYLWTGVLALACAAGIVFGAIASATDPASTLDVLWENRTRGPFTTALIAVIALDDALAMLLYGLGKSAATIITGGATSLMGDLMRSLIEIGGAVAIGAVLGFILQFLLRRIHHSDKALAISIGSILLAIGLSVHAELDVILSTMTLGFVLINKAPQRGKQLFTLVRSVSIPVYVLFFVLVGARLTVAGMPGWLWAMVVAYVACRSIGKMGGAWLGGWYSGAEDPVRRYVGMGLLAQGGVAIGLAIMASQRMDHINVTDDMTLSDVIIFTITTTTLLVQIIGLPMVKWAARLANETGRDVTEEDIVSDWKIRDALDKNVPTIAASEPLRNVINILTDHDFFLYPVVNSAGATVGSLSFESLREVMVDQDTWDWLVAADVMRSIRETVTGDMPLKDAMDLLGDTSDDELIVIENLTSQKPLGILNHHTLRRKIAEEILRRQQRITLQPSPTS